MDEFKCTRCGDMCDIDMAHDVDDGQCCGDCSELVECPSCDRWVGNLVESSRETRLDPAEYGCEHCVILVPNSRAWHYMRDQQRED